MLDLLRSLEWAGNDHTCPACAVRRSHAPDCRLDRAIRGLADDAAPHPTPDEMAREMGIVLGIGYNAAFVRQMYREHKAKQGRLVIDPASPMLNEPPTDPSALAAWLYARVVPGQTAVEYRTAAGIVGKSLVARCYAGTDRVALGIYGGETVLVPGQGSTLLTFTRLLNPDGTVLWEQK